jgi:hypothetical protein
MTFYMRNRVHRVVSAILEIKIGRDLKATMKDRAESMRRVDSAKTAPPNPCLA